MRQNPAIDTEQAITELAVGEALVSMLDAKGSPAVVERAWIFPPASRIGPLTPPERQTLRAASVLGDHYTKTVDRESAYETLKARAAAKGDTAVTRGGAAPAPAKETSTVLTEILFGRTGPRGGHHDGLLESAAKSAARSMGSGLGRQILRGVLGGIWGGRR
jgi:hypothetical protein